MKMKSEATNYSQKIFTNHSPKPNTNDYRSMLQNDEQVAN